MDGHGQRPRIRRYQLTSVGQRPGCKRGRWRDGTDRRRARPSSAGCSPAVHIDLASASLWPARARAAGQGAVPCPAASPNLGASAAAHAASHRRRFASTLRHERILITVARPHGRRGADPAGRRVAAAALRDRHRHGASRASLVVVAGDRRGRSGRCASCCSGAAAMAYVIIAVCFGLAGGIVGQDQGQLVRAVVPDLRRWCRSSACWRRSPTASSATSCAAQCPRCGRVTKIYDALCTRCGAELDFPERRDRAGILRARRSAAAHAAPAPEPRRRAASALRVA